MSKCSVCHKEEGKGKRNICRHCWRKEHTEKNRAKISKQQHDNYFRTREHRLKHWKEQYEKNPQHFLEMAKKSRTKNHETIKSKWAKAYQKHKDTIAIRAKTRDMFGYLLKTGTCQTCGSTERLTFHHPTKPYRFDIFQILCRRCHGKIHGQRHFAFDEKSEEVSK